MPVGMQALYDRMASSIAQIAPATDREFASSILQCVTCSRRILKIEELSWALYTDGSMILDFQRSIMDLCRGFVSIDNGGHVAMIHQTACEYLLTGVDRLFHIERSVAHKQLFLSCMRALMATGLRAQVKGNHIPDFLDYAVSSWFCHLALTSPDCEQTSEILNKFLTGHWVLTWIQILAIRNQLRILVQASKHLSKHAIKIKRYTAAQSGRRFEFAEQALTESWAEDLMKVMGKFGRILLRNPESIYKLIPPFCPHNSAIYQQFGDMKDKSIVVSGLSANNWDDSLARISLGFGNYASSIAAAGNQISILTSSGNNLLYDSSTFEEQAASPIRHGERVYRIQLNSTGALLATYGYRTTKIWDTSTGRCRRVVDNVDSRPRPLALLFGNDNTTLMVGTDDRRIRLLDLSEEVPVWQLTTDLEEQELDGHFLNSPNLMAMSNDGRLIAVAYRGYPLSAWEIDGPVHIGHCWRKRQEIARGEVIEAFWHPLSPEVLGLYIEGVVFNWHPYDDEVYEIATGASRLAISGDGNLFTTGDVRGTVKVFTTSDFCLLYQLVSEDSILGLAFSPDTHRFYDIRGYYGNAWEPNALLNFAEQRGRGFETESETGSLIQNSVLESSCLRIDSITTLAASPLGHLYSCGTERGSVHLHDTKQGKLGDLYSSKSFLSIEQMVWSNDGQHLCFSDSTKKIIIISLDTQATQMDHFVLKKAEIPMKGCLSGPIVQLLFHPSSDKVLIRSVSTASVIDLITGGITSYCDLDTARSKFILNPQDPFSILDVKPNMVRVMNWHMAAIRTYNFQGLQQQAVPPISETSVDEFVVDRVLPTQTGKYVMVQLSSPNPALKGKTFFSFELAPLVKPSESSSVLEKEGVPRTVGLSKLSSILVSQIAVPLGFLSSDKLVFISKDFQICSSRCTVHPAPPRSDQHNIQTLFPLPGDWFSRDGLNLSTIWNVERSLLCPRNGEVAVVRCSALV